MPNFPTTLHRLLRDMERESENRRIVSWDPNGKSFSVHQPQQFVGLILRRYFTKQTFYKSFQRQLNIYQFKGTKQGSYSHAAFVRDDPSLLQYVMRTPTINKHKTSRAPFSTSDPSHGTAVSRIAMCVQRQGLSSNTTQFELNTLLESIPARRYKPAYQSSFSTPGNTEQINILSTEDDMTPRPISELSSPLDIIQKHPAHSSNCATHPTTTHVGSLHSGGCQATRTTRHSYTRFDFIHEQPQDSHPFHFASLSNSRDVGFLTPQAVTTSRISHIQGYPQYFMDNHNMISLPLLSSKQWNQNDDDQSLETIDDIESVPQTDDP